MSEHSGAAQEKGLQVIYRGVGKRREGNGNLRDVEKVSGVYWIPAELSSYRKTLPSSVDRM